MGLYAAIIVTLTLVTNKPFHFGLNLDFLNDKGKQYPFNGSDCNEEKEALVVSTTIFTARH